MGTNYLEKHISGFTEYAQSQGVEYRNFILQRHFKYDPAGRFHSEEEANEVDQKVKEFLNRVNVGYEVLDMPFDERADYIISQL